MTKEEYEERKQRIERNCEEGKKMVMFAQNPEDIGKWRDACEETKKIELEKLEKEYKGND